MHRRCTAKTGLTPPSLRAVVDSWPCYRPIHNDKSSRRVGVRRRRFVALLSGVVAAWPLAAAAQSDRMRRIGMLMAHSETDPEFKATIRERTRRVETGRHPHPKHAPHSVNAATDACRSHRFCDRCRSGRQRLRRELGPARRQRHRFYCDGADDWREMARAAQRDCAGIELRCR